MEALDFENFKEILDLENFFGVGKLRKFLLGLDLVTTEVEL